MSKPATPHAEVDHLVVAGRTLDECVTWCEATLGLLPGPGGTHPLMGTHNRLLLCSGQGFARTYLELIAIERGKPPTRAKGLKRWFDLDDESLRATLQREGPRLIHFVARVGDAQRAVQALAGGAPGIDRGTVIEAARDTPAGRLEWRITVRDDGQRLMYGALPTLIEWGAVHPTDSMPVCGLELVSLAARHPRAELLREAYGRIGLAGVDVQRGPPDLVATLRTPRGLVTLESQGH
ncbi:VOC family protein [Variovorax sp. OV329]|uniref:VOC family protein n=1 Tax=Variovorax sp. OV329 TaxID=1882825 RepID=UPI0008EEF895|nr:VOC family protein [Variovorax sp. OV329]SFN24638.1 Glyoxalase-like domain-containing protein [Variovorax sp. OV329]